MVSSTSTPTPTPTPASASSSSFSFMDVLLRMSCGTGTTDTLTAGTTNQSMICSGAGGGCAGGAGGAGGGTTSTADCAGISNNNNNNNHRRPRSKIELDLSSLSFPMMMMSRRSSKNTDGFLVSHKTDRNLRCLLDPNQVQKMLQHQGDELMKKEFQKLLGNKNNNNNSSSSNSASMAVDFETNKNSHNNNNNGYDNDTDTESAIGTEFSTGYMTDITTATGETHLATNTDRYNSPTSERRRQRQRQLKSKILRVIENDKEMDDCDGDSDDNNTGVNVGGGGGFGIQDDDSNSIVAVNALSSPSSKNNQSKKTGVSSTTSTILKGCRPVRSDLAQILIRRCLFGEESVTLKEEFYAALHLRMPIRFGQFYTQTFLPFNNDQHQYHHNRKSPKGYYYHPPITAAPIKRTAHHHHHVPKLTSSSTSGEDYSSSDEYHATTNRQSFLEYGVSIPPSSPIEMMVDGTNFMDLGITGSLGLVDRIMPTVPITTSSYTAKTNHRKSPDHYKVLLHRRSGVPLAICSLKSPYGPPVVRIYSIKQRVFGQKPVATTAGLGLNWCNDIGYDLSSSLSSALPSYPLFTWCEFTIEEGEFPEQVKYAMYMAQGSDGRFEKTPSYTGTHRRPGSPEIMIVGKTEQEQNLTGCAILAFQQDDDEDGDGDGDHSGARTPKRPSPSDYYFSVSVAKGIDPALMLCFAAIIDETMEKTMRLQVDVRKSRTLKKKKKMMTSTTTTQNSNNYHDNSNSSSSLSSARRKQQLSGMSLVH